MIQVSVVIPNLNSPIIHQTVEALEKQTFDKKAYEVVVVGIDRFGLVNESDIVRFYLTEHPLNPAQARNRGVDHTSGEIIAFTDADCIPPPNWLQVIVNRFKDPQVSVVGGAVDIDSKNFWTLTDNLSMFHEHMTLQPPGTRRLLASLNMAISRQAFQSIQGFDERYPLCEDSDISIRLRQAGYTLFFEPTATVLHAPPRNRFKDLLRHSFNHGRFSTKINPQYANEEGLPGLFRTRWVLVLAAPVLAAVATVRIFSKMDVFRRYLLSAPFVYLAKIAWCLGAAKHSFLSNDRSPRNS